MNKRFLIFTILSLSAVFFWACPVTPPKPKPEPGIAKWLKYVDEFDGLNGLVTPSNSPTSTVTYYAGKLFMSSEQFASAYVLTQDIAIGDSFKIWADVLRLSDDFCLTFGTGLLDGNKNTSYQQHVSFYVWRPRAGSPRELLVQIETDEQDFTEIPLAYSSAIKDTCSLGLFFDRDTVRFYYAVKGDTTAVYKLVWSDFSPVDFSIVAYYTEKNGVAVLERLTFLSTDSLTFGEVPPDTTEVPPITGKRDTVFVSWSPNSEPDFSHYLAYIDSGAGFDLASGLRVNKPKNSISYMLKIGTVNKFFVTAVDTAGNESNPSNVVQYLVVNEGENMIRLK